MLHRFPGCAKRRGWRPQAFEFHRVEPSAKHAKDVAAEVTQGDMPPWFYLPMHPLARLTEAEKQALMDGAEKTLGPQEAPKKD